MAGRNAAPFGPEVMGGGWKCSPIRAEGHGNIKFLHSSGVSSREQRSRDNYDDHT